MGHIFSGSWLCDERFLREPINVYHKENQKDPPHPDGLYSVHYVCRKEFTPDKKYDKVTLDISADDFYKLYVNGRYAAEGPALGYHFNYYWNRVDITDLLKDGQNEIKIHVFYSGYANRLYVSGDLRMGVICDLKADGQTILTSDGSWECTNPLKYISDHQIGYNTNPSEDLDLRIPDPDYRKCTVRKNPDYVFSDEPVPVVQVYDRLPVTTQTLPDGGIFYDFGTELTGTLSFCAKGSAGSVVRVLCGEELCDLPCRVRYDMRCNCLYEQRMFLADGSNVFEEYHYKAFRYVTLYPGDGVTIENFKAVVRHWKFDDEYCNLKTNDSILKGVFDLCKNGVKYGTQETYVDCPSREKGQYAGDMTVTSASQLWLTGDAFMLKKAIDNQMQSGLICPGLMAVTPSGLMQEIADYSLQFPILALRYYKATGDKQYLAKNLECCRKMMQHFGKFAREDGLLECVSDKWNLVDWPDNLRDGYDFPLTRPVGKGVHNVLNAFYVGAALCIDRIKGILGLECDKTAENLRDAFNRVFFDSDTGLYVDAPGSHHSAIHSNMIPAFYGLQPEGAGDKIADFLVQRTKDGIPCGVYMAYFLLKALCKLGRYEDVYRIITSTCENSWYNMIREGGTTCFEAWGVNKKFNTSLCHPWASAPVSVIIEDLLGYSLDKTRTKAHLPDGVEAEIVFKV